MNPVITRECPEAPQTPPRQRFDTVRTIGKAAAEFLTSLRGSRLSLTTARVGLGALLLFGCQPEHADSHAGATIDTSPNVPISAVARPHAKKTPETNKATTESIVTKDVAQTMLAEIANGEEISDHQIANAMLIGEQVAGCHQKWNNPLDISALIEIWWTESRLEEDAKNSTSGAYGIPQANPQSGHTIMPMEAQGKNDPDAAKDQIQWGLSYIADRYGSPTEALQHSVELGWY